MILKFFLLTAIIFSIECCPKCRNRQNLTNAIEKTNPLPYKVIKVADGDTITVYNYSSKNTIRVRFMCIDAPEKSQGKWGELSLKKLAELLPLNTNVTLEGSSHDIYNRTISQVINNRGINVNKRMMEQGLVVLYPSQKGCNNFKDIEAAAKKAKMGVWSDSKFEMPWDYRKRNGIGYRGHGHHNSHHNVTKKAFNLKLRSY